MHIKHKLLASLGAITLLTALGTTAVITTQPHEDLIAQATQSQTEAQPSQQLADSIVQPISNQIKGQLRWNNHGAYVIGNGDTGSANLNTNVSSAPYTRNANLDDKHRATYGEALLNKTTRQYLNRNQTGQERSEFTPVGWQQMNNLTNGYSHLYDRGHLLGYALVGGINGFDASESNPQNIVTQTAWANEAGSETSTGQNYYESLVRKALDQNKTVLYKVKALYNGDELVPRATWIQAKSTDGSLNINAVIPNAENGININYQTGEGQLGNNNSNNDQSANQNNQQDQTNKSSQESNTSNNDSSQPNGPIDNQYPEQNTQNQTLPATGYKHNYRSPLSISNNIWHAFRTAFTGSNTSVK